jgi:hypothetical protein
MSQLTPCPQCHSERVWARAALGAYGITHVAFCPGCARAATMCTRCGTELVLMRQSSWTTPGRPRVQSVLQCPTCRQVSGAQPAQQRSPSLAPGPAGGVAAWSAASSVPVVARRSAMARLIAGTPAPLVMQRVADDREALATTRCVRQLQLMGLVEQAARRADAMARLEIELSRLDTLDAA